MAQNTASGVAGEASSTMPPWPNAATAARNASRTLMASMSGGSPTALLPWITPGSRARVSRATSKHRGAFASVGSLYVEAPLVDELGTRVPHQLLGREPADALNEAAFDLTAVDQR